MRLVLIFLLLLSMVIIFVGIVKILEPKNSIILSTKNLGFYHKYGSWLVSWKNIISIQPLKQQDGFKHLKLPYIGIKLNSYDEVIDSISPRLANRLIHEQRPLLVNAVVNQVITIEDSQINFTNFKSKEGRVLYPPISAFLHQCVVLRKAYGFDLFLPQSALDRDIDAFAQLLKQCRHYSHQYN